MGGYSRWFGVAHLEKEAAYELAGIPEKYNKPVLLHNGALSDEETPALQIINKGGVPVFSDVDRAAKCIASLAHYGMYLEQLKGEN